VPKAPSISSGAIDILFHRPIFIPVPTNPGTPPGTIVGVFLCSSQLAGKATSEAHGTPLAQSDGVRKFDVKIDGLFRANLAEEEIRDLFSRGFLKSDAPCRVADSHEWRDVNEFFPLLKYQVVGAPIGINELPEPAHHVDFDQDKRQKPALTSSLKAGWICFGLALAVAWIFPPAFIFYSVALVLAVIAMATHQVSKGLALLLTTFVGMGASAILSFFLAVGLFTAAAASSVAKKNTEIEASHQRQRDLFVAQHRALASLNQSLAHPPASLAVRQATPIPIQNMSKRQLFDEIARIERERRDLRRTGRDVSLTTEDYLEKLKNALDTGS
jgi:hypothetical protein